jgi:hypothetical protein
MNGRKFPVKLIDLTPIQRSFLLDTHRFITIPAGRRSRKTLIGKRKILIAALENEGCCYFMGAPTEDQARSIFWNDLLSDTYYSRKSKNATSLTVELLNGSMIKVAGLDKPERIEGRPWDGCLITESANIRPNAWPENIRPALADRGGFAILEGVPEGLNWFYDKCIEASGGALPTTIPGGVMQENHESKEWIYYSWFSSDVLPEAEIISMRNELDERTFRQEAEASFEGYGGRAYYNFSKDNLKMVEYRDDIHVHMGMDFNVNPMTATLSHIYGDEVHQFGEIYLPHSNTHEMIEEIESYSDGWNGTGKKIKRGQVIIYPDSTGRAMKSSATRSDIGLLEKAGFQVKARAANPREKDRIMSMNCIMKAASGKVRYYVNPKTCPKTIRDYNKVGRENDGRIKKDKEAMQGGLTHISDAQGYLIHYNFPVKRGEFGEV